jgi:2-oxoisovalerate dehydrogenase E2 component (dihydrolipoyl transacylase)
LSHEVFHLPDVGEGLIEADIVAWKVAVGDVVVLNQPLVDVETAKAVVELPSPYAGTVVTLHGEVGDTVEVDAPLVTVDVGEPAPHANEKQVVHDTPDDERREPVLIGYGVAQEEAVTPRRNRRGTPMPAAEVGEGVPSSHAPVRATPPVRLLAKQYGVDLRDVQPTGREGQVTRDDVERTRSGRVSAAVGPTQSSRFVGREIAPWAQGPREERLPVKGVLKVMADAMVESTSNQPQAVVWLRVDATRSMEVLANLKAHRAMAAVRLSPLTLVALAVCDAARHYPGINSSFDAERQEVVVRRYVNLGVAVDTPRGLIVPNIKDADRLDLVGMAAALTNLVDAARASTTTPADMRGGTFTITNVGPFGVDAAMAILPPGTGAILCVGRIAKSPWVHEDQLVVRQVVELAMTFDHRQIDGALASSVIAHIGRFLEDPATALLVQ